MASYRLPTGDERRLDFKSLVGLILPSGYLVSKRDRFLYGSPKLLIDTLARGTSDDFDKTPTSLSVFLELVHQAGATKEDLEKLIDAAAKAVEDEPAPTRPDAFGGFRDHKAEKTQALKKLTEVKTKILPEVLKAMKRKGT